MKLVTTYFSKKENVFMIPIIYTRAPIASLCNRIYILMIETLSSDNRKCLRRLQMIPTLNDSDVRYTCLILRSQY